MNLIDYLPAHVIEIARRIAHDDLIRVSAPEDPEDVRLLVRCEPGLERELAMRCGVPVGATGLLNLYSLSEVVRGGAKVIKPSPELCRLLSEIELNIHLRDYAQPYFGMGVVLPGSFTGWGRDNLVGCAWRPGLGINVGFYVGPCEFFQTIGPHWPGTLEEDLTVLSEDTPNPFSEQSLLLVPTVARICLNLGLFAMDRGVEEHGLDPRAERRRRRACHGGRFARLAARDAQEFVIQDLDLFLGHGQERAGTSPSDGQWRQPAHRRRGHWKMQPHGPGGSLRKRIYVPSYMVNPEVAPPSGITTTLS